jgi:hypothetical protein
VCDSVGNEVEVVNCKTDGEANGGGEKAGAWEARHGNGVNRWRTTELIEDSVRFVVTNES